MFVVISTSVSLEKPQISVVGLQNKYNTEISDQLQLYDNDNHGLAMAFVVQITVVRGEGKCLIDSQKCFRYNFFSHLPVNINSREIITICMPRHPVV